MSHAAAQSTPTAPLALLAIITTSVVATLLFALGASEIQTAMAFSPRPIREGDMQRLRGSLQNARRPVDVKLHRIVTADGEDLSIVEAVALPLTIAHAEDTESKPGSGVGPRAAGSKTGSPPSPSSNPSTGPEVALFFHGNSGNVLSSWGHVMACLEGGARVVYAVDYRGFGGSSGTPSEIGLQLDGLAALRWVLNRHADVPRARILLHGYSMGCAVAVFAAAACASTRFYGLVLEAPFTTFLDATLHAVPVLSTFQWVLANMFPNVQVIRRVVRTPLAVAHGAQDEVNPFWNGLALLDACPTRHKRLFVSRRPKHAGPHLDGRAFRWLDGLQRRTS